MSKVITAECLIGYSTKFLLENVSSLFLSGWAFLLFVFCLECALLVFQLRGFLLKSQWKLDVAMCPPSQELWQLR